MVKIINSANETLAILQNVVSPIIAEGINREFTFDFTTVIDSDKSNYVNYQNRVETESNYFNIVYTEEERTQDGLYIHAQCEHVSYDLISANLTSGFTATGVFSAVATLLFAGTAFTVGTAQVTASISVNITESTNKRSVLMQLATLYGGELKFDKYAISLLTQRGADRGAQFRYRKNLVGVKKIVDARQSVAGVPRTSYDVSVAELEFEQSYIASGVDSFEHYELGDTVTVYDEDLGLNTPLRIVKESHDVNQCMQGQVEIGNFVDDLASTLSNMQSTVIIVDNNYSAWNSTATNFDTRNDRIATTPADPVISASGTAVDHVINTDGSADISLEWAFTGAGDAYDIDGFVVLLRSSTSSAAYTFGTTPGEEHVMYATKDKLAAIFEGVPADKYYTFGVKAYRMVDQDINGAGIIYSSVVQPSLAAENPYRPSTNVEFAGNIINTINGVAVGTVTSATDLLNNVVANERLGAQVAGFTAGSVRYKQDGTQVLANLPRYETGKFGQAGMIEEGATNILLNSSFETGAGTVADSWSGATSPTVTGVFSIDNTVYRASGFKSQKVVVSASTGDGRATVAQSIAVTVGQPYSLSIYAKGSVTGTAKGFIRATWLDAGSAIIGVAVYNEFTPTGTLTCYTLENQVAPVGAVTLQVAFGVYAHAAGDTGTIYFDDAQCENKVYSTSWQIDGTARTAEVMVVPVSGNFTKGSATVELTFIPQTTMNVGGVKLLWELVIDTPGVNSYHLAVNADGSLIAHVYSGSTLYPITTAADYIVSGNTYSIMFAIDGTNMRLCNNGGQIGADTAYTEPVGTLPTFMYAMSDQAGANQANGLIDDMRISPIARTVVEHQTYYASGDPLPVDENTGIKMDFDSTLRQTTRNHAGRPQGIFMIADNDTTYDKTRATHIIPTGWTNAQVVFNQAISELPATGGQINGMDGTAIVDGSIVLPSNVTLDLTTMTIKAKDSLAAGINMITNSDQVGGNTKITVKRGTIDGNKAGSAAGVLTFGINMTTVTNSELRDITVQNCLSSNIRLEHYNTGTISGINSTGSGDAGIKLYFCNNNAVSKNVSHSNAGDGILVTFDGFGNSIIGNTCTDNTGVGIRLYDNTYKNTVTGNVCSSNSISGISLETSCKYNVIGSNTCQENLYQGIYLYTCTENNIINNICMNNNKNGIYLYNGSSDNNVIGNTCSQNSLQSNHSWSNITLETGCDRNNIQSNICRKGGEANKADYGVNIVNITCDDNVVTNNDLLTGGDTGAINNGGAGTVTDLAVLAVPGNRTA